MNRRAFYLGGAALALFIVRPRGVDSLGGYDLTVPSVPDIISRAAGIGSGASVPSNASTSYGQERLTTAQARTLVAAIDAREYGGWFGREGRSYSDLVAIMKVESGLKPNAYNPAAQSGAWGLFQVLGSTAAGLGYGTPSALFDAQTGARAGMKYLRGAWDELGRRLGKSPSLMQWVMSHNQGAAGVARGKWSLDYQVKFLSFKLTS